MKDSEIFAQKRALFAKNEWWRDIINRQIAEIVLRIQFFVFYYYTCVYCNFLKIAQFFKNPTIFYALGDFYTYLCDLKIYRITDIHFCNRKFELNRPSCTHFLSSDTFFL
jgi:hypothetical protein